MVNNLSILTVLLSILLLESSCSSKVSDSDSNAESSNVKTSELFDETVIINDSNLTVPDSINIEGILELNRISELTFIGVCRIIINSDSTILWAKGRSWYKSVNDYPQELTMRLTLKEHVADCFKQILYEIYYEHDSALHDEIPYECAGSLSWTEEFSINISLGAKNIKEFIDLTSIYVLNNDEDYDPYRPQFIKLLELLYDIIHKVESEYYFQRRKFEASDWVIEEFNYDYYEPYNEEDEK